MATVMEPTAYSRIRSHPISHATVSPSDAYAYVYALPAICSIDFVFSKCQSIHVSRADGRQRRAFQSNSPIIHRRSGMPGSRSTRQRRDIVTHAQGWIARGDEIADDRHAP